MNTVLYRMPSTRCCSAWLACSLLVLASSAQAGPVEVFAQAAFDPHDGNSMVVRYLNGYGGLFFTHDGGKTWQMQCGSAVVGEPSQELTALAIAPDGACLVGGQVVSQSAGAPDSLYQGDAHGCGFAPIVGFEGRSVVNLLLNPLDSNVMFAAISDQKGMNGILRRDADGTWSDVGSRTDALVSQLLVAKVANRLRFYQVIYLYTTSDGDGGAHTASASDSDGGTFVWPYHLRISNDEGKTWQDEHDFGSLDRRLALVAVDPTNPDRLVAFAPFGDAGDEVFVSNDQGATFSEYLSVTSFTGITFAPDGRVWIGDGGRPLDAARAKGLWMAEDLSKPPKQIADYGVSCLGYASTSDQLYACALVPGRDAFGRVDPADGTFTPLLRFAEVKDFVTCKGVDEAATCKPQLCKAYCGMGHFADAPVCASYTDQGAYCGPCVADPRSAACVATMDAGAHDAGSKGDKSGKGCSCSVLGQPIRGANAGALGLLSAVALALSTRWRRRS